MAVAAALLFLLFSASCLLLSPHVSADMFKVGDEKGWNPNVNYTIWERKHRPFHVGDWLVFYYQAGQADVLLVDEVAYEKCDASHPISNYSKGRNYAFQLNHTKTYYFICSFGYCYQGMKVAVTAEKLPSPSSLQAKHQSASSSSATAAAPFGSGLGAALLLSLSLLAPALFRLA